MSPRCARAGELNWTSVRDKICQIILEVTLGGTRLALRCPPPRRAPCPTFSRGRGGLHNTRRGSRDGQDLRVREELVAVDVVAMMVGVH